MIGIPVVKPGWIFGSPPYGMHKISFPHLVAERLKKFNTETYGFYDGKTPVVVTMEQV